MTETMCHQVNNICCQDYFRASTVPIAGEHKATEMRWRSAESFQKSFCLQQKNKNFSLIKLDILGIKLLTKIIVTAMQHFLPIIATVTQHIVH